MKIGKQIADFEIFHCYEELARSLVPTKGLDKASFVLRKLVYLIVREVLNGHQHEHAKTWQ
jgi:hypothetical protein